MAESQSFGAGNQTIVVESQPWDSDILQRKCARITAVTGPDLSPDFGPLGANLEKRGLEYVTIRWPQEDRARLSALIKSGFEIVDGIIALKRELKNENPINHPELRLATKDDATEAAQLAARSFRFSRFHNDPALYREQADKIHYEWARNSCLGQAADAVWLWIEGGKIAGFSSVALKGEAATIVLVCVGDEYSGRGIAGKLTAKCCEWMLSRGVKTARVQTQAHNIGALTVYRRCGFAPENLYSTLRWAKGQVPFNLGKLATDSFLALESAFFIELGKLAEAMGANIEDVWRGAGSDARIGAGDYNPLQAENLTEQMQAVEKLLQIARDKNLEMKLLEAAAAVESQSGGGKILAKILTLARWRPVSRKNLKSDQ